MGELAHSIESSRLATTIGQSSVLLGGLSALHLVGLTLVVGSALIANLRLVGLLFADRPAREVVGPAGRAMVIGLTISIVTGLLMFSTRVEMALGARSFRLKMALILTAAIVQVVAGRGFVPRFTGALGAVLWLGVAAAGCAFILFE